MSKPFATKFYHSPGWKNTRAAYVESVHGLCEECLANGATVPGEIVHHKIPLTPQNICDPDITLNFNNLKLVCRKCHEAEHEHGNRRYIIQPDGSLVIRQPKNER